MLHRSTVENPFADGGLYGAGKLGNSLQADHSRRHGRRRAPGAAKLPQLPQLPTQARNHGLSRRNSRKFVEVFPGFVHRS
jgi:hypothetical protein